VRNLNEVIANLSIYNLKKETEDCVVYLESGLIGSQIVILPYLTVITLEEASSI
jgi:hypothetical protein